jgi:DNA replication and repair protein RecF
MGLVSLRLKNLRCFKELIWRIESSINIIEGANGSGKTTLLEAIHFLSRGRSFRTAQRETLISYQSEGLMIQGQVDYLPEHSSSLAITYKNGQIKAFLNKLPVTRIASLAAALPVQIIDHQSHALITGGPAYRRRLIDWGVFHKEPSFHEHWYRYERALRQRNATIRQGAAARVVSVWDDELIASGNIIDELRRAYVLELEPVLNELLQRVLTPLSLNILYKSGWPTEVTLEIALKMGLAADQQHRMTRYGPHRADLLLRLQDKPVQHVLSRGQEKVLGICLLLAQIALLNTQASKPILILVDDIASELDASHLARLLHELKGFKDQLFFTAVRGDLIETHLRDLPYSMFHVEQGELRQVI